LIQRDWPSALSFARPMMRCGAGLNPNQARRQLLEECQHVTALQLEAHEHLAFRVDAVHLKDRPRNIETDRCDRLNDWLLRIVGALTAPTSALSFGQEKSVACSYKPPLLTLTCGKGFLAHGMGRIRMPALSELSWAQCSYCWFGDLLIVVDKPDGNVPRSAGRSLAQLTTNSSASL